MFAFTGISASPYIILYRETSQLEDIYTLFYSRVIKNIHTLNNEI